MSSNWLIAKATQFAAMDNRAFASCFGNAALHVAVFVGGFNALRWLEYNQMRRRYKEQIEGHKKYRDAARGILEINRKKDAPAANSHPPE